ncbi:MAG: SHD1 domain-containing protein, partial [Planctomycetota bacterium]
MLQIPVLKLLSFLLLSLFVQCQLTGSVSAQNSRFEKSRQWVDDTGQYRITATLQKLQDSTVTLLKKNGEETKLPINRLSKEDIEFLDGYRNSKFQELKTKHSEFIFASAVLESSKNYLEQGIATEEQKQELLNRIKELEPYSDSDGILFPKQIIRKNDYLAKRAEAADLVTSWIENKKGDEDHKLKLAKQIDPTSMESDLLLAIYAETYDANHRLAQRYLSDAMKQALRYRELWEATDKYNFLAIVNNLSVSYARSGYVGKAVRIWRQADKELNYEKFPQQLVSSIVRIDRMLKDRRSG